MCRVRGRARWGTWFPFASSVCVALIPTTVWTWALVLVRCRAPGGWLAGTLTLWLGSALGLSSLYTMTVEMTPQPVYRLNDLLSTSGFSVTAVA